MYLWSPNNGELRALVEDVDSNPIYGEDIVVFIREDMSTEEHTLMLFHLPTETEFELITLQSAPVTLSLSPNGRWIAYISEENPSTASLFVHEILVDEQGGYSSLPILAINFIGWRNINWAEENKISWDRYDGIWVADLDSGEIIPEIAIEPSKNTYEHPSGEIVDTSYGSVQWSPDGNYLIAIEHIYEGGPFIVIEKDSNRSVRIPGADQDYISDKVIWLNEKTFIHFDIHGAANIWHINPESEDLIVLEKSIEVESGEFDYFFLLENDHIRFSRSSASTKPYAALYDLDLDTGKLTQISQDYSHYPRPGLDRWIPVKTDWSPDEQNALISMKIEGEKEEQAIFLDFLDGEHFLDVTSTFQSGVCCWHWYEGQKENQQ